MCKSVQRRDVITHWRHIFVEVTQWEEENSADEPLSKAANRATGYHRPTSCYCAIVLSRMSLDLWPSFRSGWTRWVGHSFLKSRYIKTGKKRPLHWLRSPRSRVSWRGNVLTSRRPAETTRGGNPAKTSCWEERGRLTSRLRLSLALSQHEFSPGS